MSNYVKLYQDNDGTDKKLKKDIESKKSQKDKLKIKTKIVENDQISEDYSNEGNSPHLRIKLQ